jgi:nicotinamidase-related amidase
MTTQHSRALLVIDVQNDYFSGPMQITYPAGSFGNILQAMDAASKTGVPIVIIQTAIPRPDAKVFRKATPGWELHPEVARRPHDVLIHKELPGSFTGTNLDEWLQKHGIGTVVICGYMTQMCCDTTSRQAVHLGYKVEFLSDATGTLAFNNSAGAVTAEELHRAILVVQQSRFSQVVTAQDWIRNLASPALAAKGF